MLASGYEWNILEWDEKPKRNLSITTLDIHYIFFSFNYLTSRDQQRTCSNRTCLSCVLLSAFCAKGAVSRNIGFCNKQNLAYIKCRIPSGFFICVEVTGLLPLNSHITNGGRTLVITNYDVTDNGQYICVASDGQEFAHHIFTLNDMHPETYPWTTLLTSSTTTPVPIRPGKYKDSHNTRPYHYRFLKKEIFFIWQFQFVWHYVLI